MFTNRFNRWADKGLWQNFFLMYEEKLTRSGYSPMEVTSVLTSMQVAHGMERNEPSEFHQEDPPASFILPPMRMEIRLRMGGF